LSACVGKYRMTFVPLPLQNDLNPSSLYRMRGLSSCLRILLLTLTLPAISNQRHFPMTLFSPNVLTIPLYSAGLMWTRSFTLSYSCQPGIGQANSSRQVRTIGAATVFEMDAATPPIRKLVAQSALPVLVDIEGNSTGYCYGL
jgi:hypothetical protein